MKKNLIAAALVSLVACTSLPAMAQTEVEDDQMLNQTNTTTTVETTTTVDPMMGRSANVASLRPFSPEANYMSLPGVYRYLTFVNTGVWMTREESVANVDSQIEAATR